MQLPQNCCYPSRRDVLKAGGLAIASTLGLTSRSHLLADDPLGGTAIDAHVHVWTPDTVKYPLAKGYTKEEMKPASFTPEELFAHTRPAGVNRIVLIQMSYYGTDNSYMLDMIKKYPEQFRGVAVIDADHPEVRKTMLDLKEQGVRGFRLIASEASTAKWDQSTGIKKMWETGAEAGLKMCLLTDPGALPAVESMCKKFPETPVVIDHMARIGMSGKTDPKHVDNLCRLAKQKNVSVKTSAFYALVSPNAPYLSLAPLIRRLRDAYGADRLMWASDCPFQVENGHSYLPSIDLIRTGLDFLTAADRQWMLRDTAQKIFFS